MNPSRILSVLTVATAVAIVSGCGQQEQPAATTAPAASTAPATPAVAATPAAQAPADTATNVVQAAPAIAPVTDAATDATAQTQGVIDKAKSLVDGGQYADASKLIQQLANMQLTPDQQKMVDGLKTTIQQKLAGSSLGGLLNK